MKKRIRKKKIKQAMKALGIPYRHRVYGEPVKFENRNGSIYIDYLHRPKQSIDFIKVDVVVGGMDVSFENEV